MATDYMIERETLFTLPHKGQALGRSRITKPSYQRYPKPPYTYTGMIVMAIQNSPEKKLSLADIHESLAKMFPFFRDSRYTGWKDSVRHNLSHSRCFKMLLKNPLRKNGKGNFWTVDLSLVPGDIFKRQETPVAKQGNWAPELHLELKCPPIFLPAARESYPSALTFSHQRDVLLNCRPKRKLEEVDSASQPSLEPAVKRHQPFSIDNIMQMSQPFQSYPSVSGAATLTSSPECFHVNCKPLAQQIQQTPTPEFHNSCLPSLSDDSACFSSSSSTSASPETFPIQSRTISLNNDCVDNVNMGFPSRDFRYQSHWYYPSAPVILAPSTQSCLNECSSTATVAASIEPLRDSESCAVRAGAALFRQPIHNPSASYAETTLEAEKFSATYYDGYMADPALTFAFYDYQPDCSGEVVQKGTKEESYSRFDCQPEFVSEYPFPSF